jgi:hypothetical protein
MHFSPFFRMTQHRVRERPVPASRRPSMVDSGRWGSCRPSRWWTEHRSCQGWRMTTTKRERRQERRAHKHEDGDGCEGDGRSRWPKRRRVAGDSGPPDSADGRLRRPGWRQTGRRSYRGWRTVALKHGWRRGRRARWSQAQKTGAVESRAVDKAVTNGRPIFFNREAICSDRRTP